MILPDDVVGIDATNCTALVPQPRVNLTRFHGVCAPNSAHRAPVTQAGRGRGARRPEDSTPAERRASMTWAQRLKRVFKIDIETCSVCGGAMRTLNTRGCAELLGCGRRS